MGDWRLLIIQDTVDHEFMTLGRMHEFDDLWSLFIQMSLIVSLLVDIPSRVHQLADIHTCGFGLLLNKFNEFLQVVFQVNTLLDVGHEIFLGTLVLCGFGVIFAIMESHRFFRIRQFFGMIMSQTRRFLLPVLSLK